MRGKVIMYGAMVEKSYDDGATWERIPECKGIAVPIPKQDYKDATSLDSPGGFREWMRGLKDNEEFSIPQFYTSAGFHSALSDSQLDDPIYYRTTFKLAEGQATPDVCMFYGYPTPAVKPNGLDDPVDMDLNIRPTGLATYVQGTAA